MRQRLRRGEVEVKDQTYVVVVAARDQGPSSWNVVPERDGVEGKSERCLSCDEERKEQHSLADVVFARVGCGVLKSKNSTIDPGRVAANGTPLEEGREEEKTRRSSAFGL